MAEISAAKSTGLVMTRAQNRAAQEENGCRMIKDSTGIDDFTNNSEISISGDAPGPSATYIVLLPKVGAVHVSPPYTAESPDGFVG
jgi:hypothetical protein